MLTFLKKYKKIFIIGIVFFFSNASGFDYEACLKSQSNVKKTGWSFTGRNDSPHNLKQISQNFEIGITTFEIKEAAERFYRLLLKDSCFGVNSITKIYTLIDISSSIKLSSIPIFLKDCSLLI
ncbi:MAG: hypothetical protein PHX78_08030 [bacterium]|nr:hypothetical protein [bacterium]